MLHFFVKNTYICSMINNPFISIGITILCFKIFSLFTSKANKKMFEFIKARKRDGYRFGNNPLYDRILIMYSPVLFTKIVFLIAHILWLFYTGIHYGEIGFILILAMFLTNIFNKKTDFYAENRYKIGFFQNIINIIGIIIVLYQYA